jgi:dipeptidyl aminopeptidase/acylaminoacyl peptidase
MDSNSDLAYYRLDCRKLKTVPSIADPSQLETQPAWSPDGKHLYFASAPKRWPDYTTFPEEHLAQLRYDLKRISYDVETDRWGTVETVLSAARTGKSNVNPRVSPDGRFLLFSMCDRGNFALYQPESDLYLLNLETSDSWKLECNSDFAESWHCWSSNGRWIAFSSKRPTGIFTRLYLAHVDQAGHASKPFILPQQRPDFYDDFLLMYTLPEFTAGPVSVSRRALLNAVRDTQRVQVDGDLHATPQVPSPGRRRLGPE